MKELMEEYGGIMGIALTSICIIQALFYLLKLAAV